MMKTYTLTQKRLAPPVTPKLLMSPTLQAAVVADPRKAEAIRKFREKEEAIERKLRERFNVYKMLAESCITGKSRSLIISGPAGIGKSYIAESIAEKHDPNGINYTLAKGYGLATGIYKLGWRHREKGQTIIFDDIDRIFFDHNSLNLLKGLCDSLQRRRISWRTEKQFYDDETGEPIPPKYDFNGSVIFLTNYDFDDMIAKGHRLSRHFEALISRSDYLNLMMRTRRDYIVRIRQVILEEGMLGHLTPTAKVNLLMFIERNQHLLKEVSLRMALKISSIIERYPDNWESVARVTCLKNE